MARSPTCSPPSCFEPVAAAFKSGSLGSFRGASGSLSKLNFRRAIASDSKDVSLPLKAQDGATASASSTASTSVPATGSPASSSSGDIPLEDLTLAMVTVEEQEAANALRARFEADPDLLALVDKHLGHESRDALAMRFSRARPNSTDVALEFLRSDMQAREEKQVFGLASMSLREVLIAGTDTAPSSPEAARIEEEYLKQVPHGLLGHDKRGRAVFYRSYQNLRLWEMEKLGCSVDNVVRQHMWMNERCLESMGHKGQWVQVIDAKGISAGQCMSIAHLNFAKGIAKLDQDHYPERLGQVLVLNAPSYVSQAYKVVSTVIDEKSKEKVQIMAGPNQWQDILAEILDRRLLPKSLGGERDMGPGDPFVTVRAATPSSAVVTSSSKNNDSSTVTSNQIKSEGTNGVVSKASRQNGGGGDGHAWLRATAVVLFSLALYFASRTLSRA